MNLLFFDDCMIAPVVPVVRESSGLFHAYAMHVHLNLRPHAGVVTTMREVYLKMFVLGNPHRIVARIRKDCTKFRRIRLRTIELKMASHAIERSLRAPPFYAVQMVIDYRFSAVL